MANGVGEGGASLADPPKVAERLSQPVVALGPVGMLDGCRARVDERRVGLVELQIAEGAVAEEAGAERAVVGSERLGRLQRLGVQRDRALVLGGAEGGAAGVAQFLREAEGERQSLPVRVLEFDESVALRLRTRELRDEGVRLDGVHQVGAGAERDERQQPHRRAHVQHDARGARRHEARHERAHRVAVRVGARRVEEGGELAARREHGRVGGEVGVEALCHHRVGVPLVGGGERGAQQREVERALAELLAHRRHRRHVRVLRLDDPLLERRLGRRRLHHPVRVVDALGVHHHLQDVARLEQPAARLGVVGLELDDLREDGGALLVRLGRLERAAEAVVPLRPLRLEVDALRRVEERALRVVEVEEAQRAVRERLVVLRVRREHRGVVAARLVVALALDRLVALVAQHRARRVDVLLRQLLERLVDVLDERLLGFVRRVERVAQHLGHLLREVGRRAREFLLRRHRR